MQSETVVNVKAKRGSDSPVVGKIYPGNRVRGDFFKDGWYAVFGLQDTERSEKAAMGYVSASFVRPVDDVSNAIAPETVSLLENPSSSISENYCRLDSSYDLNALRELVPKLSKVSDPHTEDLPEMIDRKTVRVLIPYSLTHYYVADGRSFGFEFSLLKEYEKYLNKTKRRGGIAVSVEFVPVPERLVVRSLVGGLGDIEATGSAMSEPGDPQVDLTEPYLEGIGTVVVSNQGVASLQNLEELAGKQFYLGPSEGYFKTLARINAMLVGQGLAPARAVKAGGFFNTEDILELLDAGIVEFSIVESHMARLWAPVFRNIAVSGAPGVFGKGSISFAVRKNNPKLKESLNRFLKEHNSGTLLGNIYFQRYFSDAYRLKNPLNAEDLETFSKYAPLFKKYGALYGFDWMLLAAVAYQESGLDPGKKSPAGAVGLTQLLPSTASDPRIGMTGIRDDETNVHAGTKYLALLRDTYYSAIWKKTPPSERGSHWRPTTPALPTSCARASSLLKPATTPTDGSGMSNKRPCETSAAKRFAT